MTSRTPTVQQALRMVQDNPNGTNNSAAKAVLQTELERIWKSIQAHPNSYVMNNTEFAVFNCYRNTPEYNNPTAQKAVQRHWNNRQG